MRFRRKKIWRDSGGCLGEALAHGLGHHDRRRMREGEGGRAAGGDGDEAIADRADSAGEAALFATDGEDRGTGKIDVVDAAFGAGDAAVEAEAAALEGDQRVGGVDLHQREALVSAGRRAGDFDGVEIPQVLLDEDGVDAQRFGAAEGEAEVARVFDPFDQEEERGRFQGLEMIEELVGGHARLGADERNDAAVGLAMGHGVELVAIDRFDGDVELGGEVEEFLEFFDMSAMADEDDLKLALPGVEGGEDGLSAFEVFHSLGAGESKLKRFGFRSRLAFSFWRSHAFQRLVGGSPSTTASAFSK